MKLHRFIGEFNLLLKEIVVSDKALLSQWRQVLRLRTGEKIILSNGGGSDALCSLDELSPRLARVSVLEIYPSASEPGRKINLYLAILKKENFEFAVQKAVECGISTIVPVISSRTVKLGLNIVRLQRIIKEAAEQSGRGIVPELMNPIPFGEALSSASGKIIFFSPAGSSLLSFDHGIRSGEELSVFVGPEGGWEDAEENRAVESGALAVNLGPRILRAETAAIVGVFVASEFI